jgi:hypothetical protein
MKLKVALQIIIELAEENQLDPYECKNDTPLSMQIARQEKALNEVRRLVACIDSFKF